MNPSPVREIDNAAAVRVSPSTTKPALLLAAGAVLVGILAAWFYHEAGLTLSHYDAKGHLVVARRVMDNLTPGWKQIGAVWLPLPHLVNLLPVQIDWCYRTGSSAILMSVLSFGVIVYAAARLVGYLTGSAAAAAVAALVVVGNPNIVYLQATPMTEPLLLALTTLGVALLVEWVDDDSPARRRRLGVVLAAACLTRYEAWPLVGAALFFAAVALLRNGVPVGACVGRIARIAIYPLVAALAFFVQSRLTVGEWFVTGGFYVADNPDMGRPFKSIGSVWWASYRMNPWAALIAGCVGAPVIALAVLTRRLRASALVVLALAATAFLPWYAFFSGHPFRYRYMVPLVPALAVYAGCALGLVPARARGVAAALLAAAILVQARPLNARAPMVQEAQLDRERGMQRRQVTAYLVQHRGTGKLLASFGSLSHYVQELSHAGFALRDFVHEGNGDLWAAVVEGPQYHVDFVLIDEVSEGGDVLAARARENAGFLEGFRRAAEGGGVALYERVKPRE